MPGPAQSSKARNFYQILGVNRTASAEDVKRAYKRRALETHPDKLEPILTDKQKEEAEQLFHSVQEAFEVLGDPIKRHMYDKQLTKRLEAAAMMEEAARRDKERAEWARQIKEESDRRIAALRVSASNKANKRTEIPQQSAGAVAEEVPPSTEVSAEDKKKREAEMVAEILKGLYATSPELVARREAALKFKANREKRNGQSSQRLESSQTPVA
ncbi:hypothetical protein CVT24_006306 [Panaeolus cyanescens]|uniref:J domain-containing protein n=1 Tax=Panaeolus cyanescens TaxID=181874 RepID=A0A409V8L6_9AGAR|nr:hypothetical protein CVT24_006306 [Panaeolus cyanescens]